MIGCEPAVTAYRTARLAGDTDLPAWERAVSAHRETHPNLADDDLRQAVAHMIADATQADPLGFWQADERTD